MKNNLKASNNLLCQVENEKKIQNKKKKIRAQEKKEEEEHVTATARGKKVKDIIVISPVNMENEAERPDPKINEYIGDIAMSLTKKVEFAKMLELVLRSREHCWLKAVDRGGSRCDRGFKVRDGYDKSERIMFFTLAIIGPEDTRGLPRQLHMSQAPAIIGGCTLCVIIGC